MSDFSDKEENELVNFENLEILDLFEDDSEIDAAECIDINSGKKKIILIKINKSNKSNHYSANSKSLKEDLDREEINELKYNLYLGLFRDCVPATKECEEIIKNRYLVGQRVIIQPVERKDGQKIFHPKKYVFIPPNGNRELYFNIGGDKRLKISKGKNLTMQLITGFGTNFQVTKYLNEYDESNRPDIANILAVKINDKISENEKSPIKSNNNNQQNEIIINSINSDKDSERIKNEFETKSKQSTSKKSKMTNESELSKLDHSSENEFKDGKTFFEEIEEGTKYIKYSYHDSFSKEVDGVYYNHPGINLGIEKKDLDFNEFQSYEGFKTIYDEADKNNDLRGYIIMKNFEEKTIPKNTPFIIEIKAGFELIKLLKQIKKSSKYINNLQNYNKQLPKYFIGILCSFNHKSINFQIRDLKYKYDGTNNEDKTLQLNLLQHITKIIGNNNINFVIAVIKDEMINKYYLGKNDYDIEHDGTNQRRVDLLYMYKAINDNYNPEQEELAQINQKIGIVTKNYLKAYKTFIIEKTVSIPLSKKIKQEETMKKMGEENKKIKEENKKIQEENIKILEENKKMKEMQEENKKMMKKMQEENKKMQEMMKKMQEEMMKNKQEEKKKMFEEEKKAKEDRSKNEQAPENHEEKNIRKPKNI